MQLGLNSEMLNAILYNVKNLISIYKMYVTLKFDDNGCCRIHSVSDDGNGWIVTNKRYVIMPWKIITRHGRNMSLKEVVDGIFSLQESEAKERERREREKEEIESKRKEYYETQMKKETERLNNWVGWYERKLKEIDELLQIADFECWRGYIESVKKIKIVE